MDYWRMVLWRAVQETVKDTKLDTWAGAMMVLVGPVLASGVFWLLLGYALPDSAGWARIVAAAVPLLTGPVALGMRLAAVPAALHGKAAERIAELEHQLADLESTRARNRATLMRFYSDAQPILDRGFDGGFKWLSQHGLCDWIGGTGPEPRQVSSSQGSFAACC